MKKDLEKIAEMIERGDDHMKAFAREAAVRESKKVFQESWRLGDAGAVG